MKLATPQLVFDCASIGKYGKLVHERIGGNQYYHGLFALCAHEGLEKIPAISSQAG